jgi:hypothetical protein
VREVVVDALTGVEVNPDSLADSLAARTIRIALPEGISPNKPEDVARFQAAQTDSGSRD